MESAAMKSEVKPPVSADTTMAKKKTKQEEQDSKDAKNLAIKVEARIVRQLRIICDHRGIDIVDYASDLLRVPVATAYRIVADEIRDDANKD